MRSRSQPFVSYDPEWRSDKAVEMRDIDLGSRVLKFIQQHGLIPAHSNLLVGVSGGADSVCLMHILARWQKKLGIELHVAHFNHQLRGSESEADADYVAELADSLGVPLTLGTEDVAGYRARRSCCVEEAARELRYKFLARVATELEANGLAIGHTRDDQVETILMHILRGTGTSGLSGLEPRSPMVYAQAGMTTEADRSTMCIIRPLLNITREETLNYCQEQHLQPRSDSSNLSLEFFRNRLRLELLPLLRHYNPSIEQALLRLAKIARDDSAFIEEQALQLWNDLARREQNAIYINKTRASALPLALQRQVVRSAIDKLIGDTHDIEASHIEAIRDLLGKPVGKKVSLPHGLRCWTDYGEIVVASPQASRYKERGEEESAVSVVPNEMNGDYGLASLPALKGEFPLNIPGDTLLPGWRVVSSIIQERTVPTAEDRGFVARFDLAKTGIELFIRCRQPGDRFQPLGMNTSKKLQGFMVNAKIPLSLREHIPLVCSREKIIWVAGWRIDDGVKVTEATSDILRLEFIRSL
jgi:tRNA(Ile)-lysidine synthase